MDRVLQPLEERLKLLDSPLQRCDAPLVPRIRRLGSRVRSPPAATQLNDPGEDRNSTHRPPAWIAGTRHGANLRLPLSRKPREGRRSKTQRAVQAAPASSPTLLVSQRARPRPRASWCSPGLELRPNLVRECPETASTQRDSPAALLANDAPAPGLRTMPTGVVVNQENWPRSRSRTPQYRSPRDATGAAMPLLERVSAGAEDHDLGAGLVLHGDVAGRRVEGVAGLVNLVAIGVSRTLVLGEPDPAPSGAVPRRMNAVPGVARSESSGSAGSESSGATTDRRTTAGVRDLEGQKQVRAAPFPEGSLYGFSSRATCSEARAALRDRKAVRVKFERARAIRRAAPCASRLPL